jgi:hypothetical protein
MIIKVVDTHEFVHAINFTQVSDFSTDDSWLTDQFIRALQRGEWFQTVEGDWLSPVHIVRVLSQ